MTTQTWTGPQTDDDEIEDFGEEDEAEFESFIQDEDDDVESGTTMTTQQTQTTTTGEEFFMYPGDGTTAKAATPEQPKLTRASLTSARTDFRLAQTNLNDARNAHEQAAKAYGQAITKGLSQRVIDRRQGRVDVAKATLDNALARSATAQAALQVLEDARQAREREYADALDAAVQERFGQDPELLVDRRSYSRETIYELVLLEMDENSEPIVDSGIGRDGQHWSEPRKRFGMDCTVYGPRREYDHLDRETHKMVYTTKASELNWGSSGSMDLATVAEKLALYQTAYTLATFLDRYVSEHPLANLADEDDE